MSIETQTSETFNRVVDIPQERLNDFEKKMKALGRKAKRYGLPEPKWTVIEEFTKQIEEETGTFHDETTPDGRVVTVVETQTIERHFAKVQVEATLIRTQGSHKFIARIEHEYVPHPDNRVVPQGASKEEAEEIKSTWKTVLRNHMVQVTQEDDTRLARYRDAQAYCDHCGHNRKRKMTYVIHDLETDEYHQIGSTCIKDFFGLTPEAAIWSCEFVKSITESYSSGGGSSRCFVGFRTWVKEVLASIETWGYVKKVARNSMMSTVDTVLNYFYSSHHSVSRPTPEAYEEAKKLLPKFLDHFEGLANDVRSVDNFVNMNNFEYAIGQAAAVGYVKPDNYAKVAGAVASFRHKLKLDEERNLREESFNTIVDDGSMTPMQIIEGGFLAGDAEWYDGEVKERYEETVLVQRFLYSANWGCNLCEMRVKGTNATLFWFGASSEFQPKPDTITEVKIRFTIKGHRESSKYGKSTGVNRVSARGDFIYHSKESIVANAPEVPSNGTEQIAVVTNSQELKSAQDTIQTLEALPATLAPITYIASLKSAVKVYQEAQSKSGSMAMGYVTK